MRDEGWINRMGIITVNGAKKSRGGVSLCEAREGKRLIGNLHLVCPYSSHRCGRLCFGGHASTLEVGVQVTS